MSALLPCPSCARHVRATSSSCPFCHCALTPVDVPVATTGGARVSRAMLFAFGATLIAGSALDGCAESATPVYGAPAPPLDASMNDAGDAAVDVATDGAPADDGSPGVRYGAPPVDP